MDKQPYYKSTKYDDDGSFFDLNAKRWNGSNLDFERFIGFVSIDITIEKVQCMCLLITCTSVPFYILRP
jgi:hypothetical protein